MKQILFLPFCVLWMALYGQDQTYFQSDSLRRELAKAKDDTTRILLQSRLSESYRSAKPDSALLLAEEAFNESRRINYPRGEANALIVSSVLQRELGNLSSALDAGIKALRIARENALRYEEIFALIRISNVYIYARNFTKALSYIREAEKKLEDSPFDFFGRINKLFLADIHEQQDQLDSAQFYVNQVGGENTFTGEGAFYYRILGNISVKKENIPVAIGHYLKSAQFSLNRGDFRSAATSYNHLARAYQKLNQRDSAIYYAREGLKLGEMLSYRNRILTSGKLLAELYENTDPAEALRYYKLASAAEDSLYGPERVQKLQAITLEEQERQREESEKTLAYRNRMRLYALLTGLGFLLVIAVLLFRNNRHKQKAFELLTHQKKETDIQRAKAEKSLEELKSTQALLIQSEKMASLGELTAGIAHEIQNPLNFVNNFSEVSIELAAELKEALDQSIQPGINRNNLDSLINALVLNQQKINQHGRRADSIVKGMLQHSRSSTGQMEPTDINSLVDEYMRLSYHGLRARDNSFSAILETHFDPTLEKINALPQDLGRVLLNLFTNAFYSVAQKKKLNPDFEPQVCVSTKNADGMVVIRVHDNGMGIPENLMNKIYQPFFTTKPTGKGTGLGLSLSYDIITKGHGGKLKAETKENEFAEFIIEIPTKTDKTKTQ
jgi:two-component system NtrC family sensor kinase